MPAASHNRRSSACSEVLRSRDIADLDARMGQNPTQGRALNRAETIGRGAYGER